MAPRAGGLLLAMLVVAACAQMPSATPEAAVATTPTPAPRCDFAPKWIVLALRESIHVKGAKLAKAYIYPATNLIDGPPIVLSDRFAKAWWVGGRINGRGVDDEVATWLTNSLDDKHRGLIFGVSAAARRYSDLGADNEIWILGDGEAEVRYCVG